MFSHSWVAFFGISAMRGVRVIGWVFCGGVSCSASVSALLTIFVSWIIRSSIFSEMSS